MNRSGWILLLGAAAIAAVLAVTATRERARSSEEELRGVVDRMKRGRIDREEALSELDHLVDRSIQSGDHGLIGRVRLARGRILMDIDALDRAREDFQVVLGLQVLPEKESREVEDDLIALDLRAEKFPQGLERVEAILRRNPDDANAWARKGELHRGSAERTLDRAREIVGNRILSDTAAKAREVLDRLGAMDPSDPRRPAVGRDLADRFDTGDDRSVQQVLRIADEASVEYENARTAFATSLSDLSVHAGRGSAMAGLLELLDRAGRWEDAAELGTCALKALQERGDAQAVAQLISVLDHLDRRSFASELGRWLIDRDSPIESWRLLELCSLFYRAERWPELQQAAARATEVGNGGEISAASLYSGLAQVHLGAFASGRSALENWVKGEDPEPFSGARAEAWRRIAEAAGHQRMKDDEIDALNTAIRLDPDGAGPSLVQLSILQFASAHGGYRGPEEMWAQAMNLMPERTDQMLVRWKRMGEEELKSEGLKPNGRLDAGWRRIQASPGNASAFELYSLADFLLDLNQSDAAEPLTRLLVQKLPSFVPGLDLAIRAEWGLQRTNDVLALLLARMRAAGADSNTRAILSRMPRERISPETSLQFMSADPEGFGRREIARGFLQAGEPELALRLVGDAEGPNGLLETRLVAARACLDTDRADRAFDLLLPLGRHVSSRAEAFELYARASALSGHREDLQRATTRAAAGLVPRRKQWLALCDTLLALGEPRCAMPLIRRLDSDRRTRGGDVLLRRAWAELLLGDDAALRRTLERAAAFDTQGEVELVGVLACSRGSGWDGLPEAVDALQHTGWKPSRLQTAVVAALGGKRQVARKLIDAELASDAVDPAWVLADAMLAAEEGEEARAAPASFGPDLEHEAARFVAQEPARDPRTLWCALLVLDVGPAAGWIRPRLPETAEPSFWPAWISVRLARARGEPATERRLLENLASTWPAFAPAWDRLEEIARGLHTSTAGMEELRERRLHGLALRAGSRAQIDLEIARSERRSGDLDAALESARKALELDPASAETRAELGRIHAARGEWREAVESSVRASRMDARTTDAPSTGDLIAALAGAGRTEPPALPLEGRQAELEALEKRVPDDPRVPVALAWMDLEADPRNPTLAVARAYARLDRFLDAHKDVAVESLCSGADATWTDLLLTLDPARARAFLDRERARIPTALEPWLQLGRVGAAERRAASRPDELDLVRRMAPVPAVLLEHARVRLSQAPTMPEIAAWIEDIRRAEGKKKIDGEFALLVARALFDLGPRTTPQASTYAAALASGRDQTPEFTEAAKLLQAEALIASGKADQAARAHAILEDLEKKLPDPYRATVVLACTRIAAGLAEEREP